MEFIFIEMFCGIGGFRLGLERSEWKCVWANDTDKYACQIYRKNFGDGELVEGDIRSVDVNSIPDHTLLTAGFPCQSFSFAGKRKGFEDACGALFYDIARVASVKRPLLLLLENVKGLLSNDKGKTFAKILQTLDELGYDVEWQVLNSKYFGVPQNRERVFIVGHLRGTGSRQIFPIGQAVEDTDRTYEKTRGEGTRLRIANTLSSRYYKDGSENLILLKRHMRDEIRNCGQICPTLTETNHKNYWLLMTTHTKANIKQRIQNRESTWTLDGTKGKMAIVQLNGNVRRLMPVECERLQGFPDNWTKLGLTHDGQVVNISDTQRYKLLGNAVTVNVIEFLGKKLKEVNSMTLSV